MPVKEFSVNLNSPENLDFPPPESPQVEIPWEPDSISIAILNGSAGDQIKVSFGPQRTDDLTLTVGQPTAAMSVAVRERRLYFRLLQGDDLDVQVNACKAK